MGRAILFPLLLTMLVLCAQGTQFKRPGIHWGHRSTAIPWAVKKFFRGYFGALSRCDINRALSFWTSDAVIYASDGSIVGKPELEKSLSTFCQNFGSLNFSANQINRVDSRSYYASFKISDAKRLSKPVHFSDAFTFRFVPCGSRYHRRHRRFCARAHHLVTSINPAAVQTELI